jgi:DNA (cytosine-5)-methyltransferase 1
LILSYQVRHKVLQAGHYGAPQGRGRVIFWGAKRGLKIPQFPVPVYAFPKGMHRISLPTGGFMQPLTRSLVPGDYHQCAPLKPITVNEAVEDLVRLEYR